ncbi:MAG: HDOD domain-containing protein [bacterium]|nr:HDOD domain-containing protein [bacterium]
MAAHRPKERMKLLVEKIDRLPTIPATLSKILEIIQDPGSGARDLEMVVVRDPAIAAKVMAIANSPFYGFKQKVVELSHAISLIGFNAVKNVAIGLSVFSCFDDPYSPLSSRIREIYLHSFAVAFSADKLARYSMVCPVEPAFLCGLLHDVGKMVLIKLLDLNYNNILEIAQDKKEEVASVEIEVLGLDHADAGAWLIGQWGLPDVLVEAVRDHHAAEGNPMGRLLGVSNLVSRQMGYGGMRQAPAANIEAATLDSLGLTDDHVQKTMDTIAGSRDTITGMMI